MNIIDKLGGPALVARMVGCKPPSVVEWRTRGVPQSRCPAIERGTDGAFPCEQVRPDLHWHRVPDKSWPWHPEGRPLVDVTRSAEAA